MASEKFHWLDTKYGAAATLNDADASIMGINSDGYESESADRYEVTITATVATIERAKALGERALRVFAEHPTDD